MTTQTNNKRILLTASGFSFAAFVLAWLAVHNNPMPGLSEARISALTNTNASDSNSRSQNLAELTSSFSESDSEATGNSPSPSDTLSPHRSRMPIDPLTGRLAHPDILSAKLPLLPRELLKMAPQEWGRGRDPWEQYDEFSRFDYADRRGVPMWHLDRKFEQDAFRFVRVAYSSHYYGRRGRGRGGWLTDYPDSELNFSYRLQQLTSIAVNPQPICLPLTDKRLFDFPFLYIIEPGSLSFYDDEIVALRRYLLNGGFLMLDDFWGSEAGFNVETELRRVFPDRELEELDLKHELFHYVYDLKEKPQVPGISHWRRFGDTSERGWDSDEPHYKVIRDDEGRVMVLFCHNTDLGDGWEREAENRQYFELFSEKLSYPMGINIVLYAMTH